MWTKSCSTHQRSSASLTWPSKSLVVIMDQLSLVKVAVSWLISSFLLIMPIMLPCVLSANITGNKSSL